MSFLVKFTGVFWLGFHLRKQMIKMLNKADDGGSFGWHDANWLKKNGAPKSKYFKTSLVDTNPKFNIDKYDFTNKKIFKTDQSGKLVKDDNGSLTKLKYDNYRSNFTW